MSKRFIKLSNIRTGKDCYVDSHKIVAFCEAVDKDQKTLTEVLLAGPVNIQVGETMEQIVNKLKETENV